MTRPMFVGPSAALKYAALALIFVLAGLVMWASARDTTSVLAATFTVTKLADTADGSCDADCSLREAITAANASAGADAISLPAGTHTLSIAGAGEDANATGDLDITDDVTIAGAGPNETGIDAASLDRVFDVRNQAHVELSKLTITGGGIDDDGGGVQAVSGELQITNVLITGNTATEGGGVYGRNATVVIEDSNIVANTASSFGGGGVYNEVGDMTLTRVGLTANSSPTGRGGGAHNEIGVFTMDNSSVVQNTTGGFGGGGFYNEIGDVLFTNVTFSGNQALSTSGGAVYLEGGDSTFTNVTLAENRASIGGGFSYEGFGSLTIKNSILAEGDSGVNCAGALPASGGHNLDSGGSCGFLATGDMHNTDPRLAPLASAGEQTQFHVLLPDSPAIDSVATGSCPPPATDQLNVERPQGDACDIGALEFVPMQSPTPTASPTSTPTPTPTATPTPTPGPPCPGATAPPGGTCPPCPGFEALSVQSTCPPTATPAGESVVWGDANCSGSADPVDSLLTLRFDAGLSTNTGDCPEMGQDIEVLNASLHPWGDVDCGGDVTPVDSLKLLRYDAGLNVSQEQGCPEMGSEVLVLE